MVDIHLSSRGSILVGASDSPNYQVEANTPDIHLYVALSDLSDDLSLVTIDGREADHLGFFEATIWQFD